MGKHPGIPLYRKGIQHLLYSYRGEQGLRDPI